MDLLFIAPSDLGEVVLSTGPLAFVLEQTPGVALSVVSPAEAAPLFRAAPARVLGLESSGAGLRGALSLARSVGGSAFDLILDFSGYGAGRFVRAARRKTRKRGSSSRPLVEDLSKLVGAAQVLAPHFWIDDDARVAAARIEPGALLVLAPGAQMAGERWPAERFAAVARRLAGGGGPLFGARVALIGAERDVSRRVAASLDADGVAAQDLSGEFDFLAQAALLQRATLFVGNAGPQMHMAAALNAPTLGLFGPTDERMVGPHGPRARVLRGRPYEAIMAGPHSMLDAGGLLNDISIDCVEEAALDLLRAGGLR